MNMANKQMTTVTTPDESKLKNLHTAPSHKVLNDLMASFSELNRQYNQQHQQNSPSVIIMSMRILQDCLPTMVSLMRKLNSCENLLKTDEFGEALQAATKANPTQSPPSPKPQAAATPPSPPAPTITSEINTQLLEGVRHSIDQMLSNLNQCQDQFAIKLSRFLRQFRDIIVQQLSASNQLLNSYFSCS